MTTQSEQTLENDLVQQLAEQGYERVAVPDSAALLDNLKTQLEKHNAAKLGGTPLSEAEFKRVVNHLDKGNVFDRAKILRDKMHLVRDDGTSMYLEFINMREWCKNEYQVTQQITQSGDYKNRYDVTLLINGLPLVQIELKRRGIELKEAFNQINRYRRHSYASSNGLFQYVQLFVISNGVDTKYYANSVSYTGTKKASFKQTFYWTDRENKRISQLSEFADTFLEKCHVSKMITKYTVLNETDKVLMVLRPYQYYAVERIVEKVNNSRQGGYIWHTTGSGKTLTSFKASQIMTENPDVDKVLFVVDRNDLDYQTIKEFNSFKEGSVDSTDNTGTLVKQLSDPDTKLIVTTIQKLDNAIKKERHARAMEAVRDQRIVFIFDECHRSQFGETHHNITQYFSDYQMFGFTGTPIFADNAASNSKFGKRTTADLFGDQLHSYVITDAINDGNVLRFSVEYVGRFKQREDSDTNIDIDVEAIDTREVMESDQRIGKIVDYVIANHDRKTHSRDFTAMMAVSSVDVLRKYYDAFQTKKPDDLKVATIFSYQANEEDKDADGLIDEVDIDMSDNAPVNEHSRDVLERAMGDYNQTFGTNYTTRDSKSFYNYYKDIARRVKSREIDILLVVNMFLTGFDSKTLNTLYVDKNLRYHGLLQAYSRTNRILNEVKSQGNIVVFRNLKKATDDAIALFSNKDAKETIFLKPYEAYVREFDAKVGELLAFTPELSSIDALIGESEKKRFIELFREVMRTRNVLLSFTDFDYADTAMTAQQFEDFKSKYLDLYFETKDDGKEKDSILNEVDFELELIRVDNINVDYILQLLARYVEADDTEKAKIHKQVDDLMVGDEKLRSKRELIDQFINGWLPNVRDSGQVDEEFQRFWSEAEERAIDQLASEEQLNRERLQALLERYTYSGRLPRNEEYANALAERPPIRERSTILNRVATRFQRFIETFVDNV